MHINSGYRTPEHNAKVGGVKSLEVARYTESLNMRGIGWYEAKAFTHVDMRPKTVRWKDSGSHVVKTFGSPSSASGSAVRCPYSEPAKPVRYGAKGNEVKWLQWHLDRLGEKLTIDGSYGMLTRLAVLRFQKGRQLDPDGIVGPKTRAALRKAVGQ